MQAPNPEAQQIDVGAVTDVLQHMYNVGYEMREWEGLQDEAANAYRRGYEDGYLARLRDEARMRGPRANAPAAAAAAHRQVTSSRHSRAGNQGPPNDEETPTSPGQDKDLEGGKGPKRQRK